MNPISEACPAHLTARLFPQPTLSLYLGGSGHLVGQSLQTLELGMEERQRSWIESFFLDAQEPAGADHERARHYCYRNLDEFFGPIYRDFSELRFPDNLGANPVMSSCDGCGVTRIFGAASLVACRDDFAKLIEDAAARLKRRRRESSQPIQVFLTASSCGGTGAGMILDAAALIRHVFRQRLAESPRILMFLLGPEIFIHDPSISLREEQRDRMLASNYALLKELHHFAQGHEFVSSYRLRDEDIRITNRADNDRLFDWVFYLDGKSEGGNEPRSLSQMAWIVAESQLHLALTEVGRKVVESLPNQREERVRDYALHHVHARKKEWMEEGLRDQLALSARRTFLASLSVQNVRFPAEEVKRYFAWRWTRDGLGRLVRHDPAERAETVEELDRLLGFEAGEIVEGGLLADWGLDERTLTDLLIDSVGSSSFEARSFSARWSADRMHSEAARFLAKADELLAEGPSAEADSSDPAANDEDPDRPLRQALALWSESWETAFSRPDGIERQLWELAADELNGRGLGFLDEVLRGVITRLDHLASVRRPRPGAAQTAVLLTDAKDSLNGLRRSVQREKKSLRFHARSLLSKSLSTVAAEDPYSAKTQGKVERLTNLLNQLSAALASQQSEALVRSVAPRIWREVSRRLQRWREEWLLPALTTAEAALAVSASQLKLAEQALRELSGIDPEGRPWISGSTVQVADPELLKSFSERLAERIPVEKLLLRPLLGRGVAFQAERIAVHTLRDLDREQVSTGLYQYVRKEASSVLSILDSGWMLPELRQRLSKVAAPALDLGLEPLTSYSGASVGLHRQGYLLVPDEMVLPEPFGRVTGSMNRLRGSDPMRLGVVSFVFGIPPNALQGIGEAYTQYVLHYGDSPRRAALDRYPLHVFRGAGDRFAEPHSPLGLPSDGLFLEGLVDLARHLGWVTEEDEVELDIRSFPALASALQEDWNRVIELAERVLASQPHAAGTLGVELMGTAEQAYRRLCAWRQGVARSGKEKTGDEGWEASVFAPIPGAAPGAPSPSQKDSVAPGSDNGEGPS